MEQLEDGQALVRGLALATRSHDPQQGMVSALVLGQRVDPGILQQVPGDIGS